MKMAQLVLVALAFVAVSQARVSEVWSQEQTEAAGFVHKGSHIVSPRPQDYIKDEDLPLEVFALVHNQQLRLTDFFSVSFIGVM